MSLYGGLLLGKILIIGFGNILMGDDGAGVHLIQNLLQQPLPSRVELLDGGVNSFAALAEMKNAKLGILIDAMSAGGEPGDIYRLTAAQLNNQTCQKGLSVHDFSLLDSLKIANKMDELPPVIIYGIEPEKTELGMELSNPVKLAVEKVVAKIMEDLRTII